MRKKLKNQKGFTLIEMMACIVTMLLLSGICSTGINFALECYKQSVFESESQMLKSTLDLTINDILRYATDVKTGEANKVTGFTNTMYQIAGGMIEVPTTDANKNKFVVYNLPKKVANTDPEPTIYLLVGDQVYGDNLYIDTFELTYDTATHCFEGTYTIKSTVVSDASKTCKFTCRTISE